MAGTMDIFFVEVEFNPNEDALLSRVGLERESDEAEDFLALVEQMRPLARPKTAYAAVQPEADAKSGRVVLNGVEFQSRVLAGHLADEKVVWPHVATCGREMYMFAQGIPDPFERYWCDEIMQAALSEANAELLRRVEKEYNPGKLGKMGPGSLGEWPIEQQAPLFSLLREGVAFCGVELTPTMLMLPQKSVSGILFPSENGWESCRLCTREKCPNRKAEYNPAEVGEMEM